MAKRIYQPLGSEGYELCHPRNSDDFETINSLVNGELRETGWNPIVMTLIRKDEGKVLLESDCPWLGEHALIFRPRAVDALGSLLRIHGELLPLACDGQELRLFNATKVIDALDHDASDLLRFKNGRVMDVLNYSFRAAAVRDAEIFKIPDLRTSPTFVGEKFVRCWKEAGLVGLDFDLIWSE